MEIALLMTVVLVAIGAGWSRLRPRPATRSNSSPDYRRDGAGVKQEKQQQEKQQQEEQSTTGRKQQHERRAAWYGASSASLSNGCWKSTITQSARERRVFFPEDLCDLSGFCVEHRVSASC
jgi:hypothetical protein